MIPVSLRRSGALGSWPCCDSGPDAAALPAMPRPAFSQPAAASQVLKLAVGLLGSLLQS